MYQALLAILKDFSFSFVVLLVYFKVGKFETREERRKSKTDKEENNPERGGGRKCVGKMKVFAT